MSISTCLLGLNARRTSSLPGQRSARHGVISTKASETPADRPRHACRLKPCSRALTHGATAAWRTPRRSGAPVPRRRRQPTRRTAPRTARELPQGDVRGGLHMAGPGSDFAVDDLHMRRTQHRRHGRGRPSGRAPQARARVTQFDGPGKASYREALIDRTSTGPIAQSVRAAGS